MTWKVDNAHTALEFSVRHMMVSTVRGNFTRFRGQVELDLEDPTRSRAQAEIEVASIETREEGRNGHLRSADFFDAEHHPLITYRSGRIRSGGGDHFQVEGELTIKGVTRPLQLEVEFMGARRSPQGVKVAGFSASGSLSRKDFGLNWNVALESGGWLVGDEVKIRIDAEAQEVQEAKAPVADAA